MTTDELKKVIDQFNADHSGVYEARLYIIDIPEQKRKVEKEKAEYLERMENNLSLESIKEKFNLGFGDVIRQSINDSIDCVHPYFYLTVFLDRYDGTYAIHYTPRLIRDMYNMPSTDIREKLELESVLGWLEVLETRIKGNDK